MIFFPIAMVGLRGSGLDRTADCPELSVDKSSGDGRWAFHGAADVASPADMADFHNGDDDFVGNTHACVRPVELLNTATGELIAVRCGSRSEKRCSGCSWLYKKDTAKILRSGLCERPGLGAFRFFFLTLTAPSFGACHVVAKRGERKRCRCGVWHDALRDADLRGVPLDCGKYDYEAQAAFNYQVGALWNVTLTMLRKALPDLEFAKVFEWQQRGAIHLHVILRIPASNLTDLGDAVALIRERAVSATALQGGLRWGSQCRCDEIGGSGMVDKVIGYVKKAVSYVTKDVCAERVEGAPRHGVHVFRLECAARSMHCDRCAELMRKGSGVDVHHRWQLVRRLRSKSQGFLECSALPHRRWGARAGVMSTSRATAHRTSWSLSGLTRSALVDVRAKWFQGVMLMVRMVVEQLEACSAQVERIAPS